MGPQGGTGQSCQTSKVILRICVSLEWNCVQKCALARVHTQSYDLRKATGEVTVEKALSESGHRGLWVTNRLGARVAGWGCIPGRAGPWVG